MIANEVLQHARATIIENYDTKELRKRLEGAPIREGLELVETAKRARAPILTASCTFENLSSWSSLSWDVGTKSVDVSAGVDDAKAANNLSVVL